jgi:lysophospholipase L1-like esterase
VEQRAPGIRRGVRRTATAALALLWVGMAFLLLETLTRFHVYWTARNNRLALEEMERRVGLMAAFDETLWEVPWFRYKPSTSLETEWRGRTCRVATNRLGFRDDEIALPKPHGLYRIACVGGSTTVEGWTNETTYPALLEARLIEALGPGTVEVVNCGISAMTTDRELLRLPDYLALQPDLILEYGCVNDITALVPRLLRTAPPWQNLLARSQFLNRLLGPVLLPSDEEFTRRIRRMSMNNLATLAQRSAEAGTAVAFMSFAAVDPRRLTRAERAFVDYTQRVDREGQRVSLACYRRWVDMYNEELERFCRERGHAYIPLAEEMPGEMAWFCDFCHMTEEGIARKAEIIARHLAPLIRARQAEGLAPAKASGP